MRAWTLLLCVGHTTVFLLLAPPGSESKRYDPSMVDPLSRRSMLDKNFMRFGRSSPSFFEDDEPKKERDSLSTAGTNKEDSFLRSMRGKESFIRFGRGRSDNFMRFGRGKHDNFMRYGKALDENLMRYNGGKQAGYMRFGRGEGNTFMRSDRGKNDNYMRFGRSRQDNFMRFGRGKQDSFMRLGRGKQDSFMRLGRGKQDSFMRLGRGKEDSYMRFGRDNEMKRSFQPYVFGLDNELETDILKGLVGDEDKGLKILGGNLSADKGIVVPTGMRTKDDKVLSCERSKQDSFGKSDYHNSLQLIDETRKIKTQEKNNFAASPDLLATKPDEQLVQYGRQLATNVDGFGRLGKLSQERPEGLVESEFIPPRLKRSILTFYEAKDGVLPEKRQDELIDNVLIALPVLPEDLEEEYTPEHHEDDYMNKKKKRSVINESSTPMPLVEEDITGFISENHWVDPRAKTQYPSAIISAGLPNVIVGPEFSLLPDLYPPPNMLKRGPGDRNFLRFG